MPPARIGHRFEQLGQALESSCGKPALGLLLIEGGEDALACDPIHGRLLLETRWGLLSLASLSWEAPLSNHSQALTLSQGMRASIPHEHVVRCGARAPRAREQEVARKLRFPPQL